jgi:branched-chain amino acid transport system permease protein
MESLVSILFHGAAVGVVYGLLALGFSLIYSTCKVFNIAHGAFWLVGCYGTVAALKMNAPFPISVVIGILLSAAVGVLSEVVVFAPLEFREAPPTVTLLSSLAARGESDFLTDNADWW